MRGRPKRFVCDPSIATGVLRVVPRRLVDEPEFMGGTFEALAIRDLRAYADANHAEVRYYTESGFEVDAVLEDRDTSTRSAAPAVSHGFEVDAVLEDRDGRWIAVEIKLNCSDVSPDKAKRALKLLAKRTQEAGKRSPAKLVAVFGASAPGAHTGLRIAREQDGVAIVSATTIGP